MRASSSAFSNSGSPGFSIAWLACLNQFFSDYRERSHTLGMPAALPKARIKLLLAYPLMPVKLLMGIRWEALLLRLKVTPPRPKLCTLPGSLRPASRWLGVAAQ